MDAGTKINQYCSQRGFCAVQRLGQGKDGAVWGTSAASAVKVFNDPYPYQRERDVYFRLRVNAIRRAGRFWVPSLIDWDNEALIIEMEIVEPPFILDFASAWLDQPPDFPEEVLEQWREEIRERFAPRHKEVHQAMDGLARHAGVYLLDVHPNNIKFD